MTDSRDVPTSASTETQPPDGPIVDLTGEVGSLDHTALSRRSFNYGAGAIASNLAFGGLSSIAFFVGIWGGKFIETLVLVVISYVPGFLLARKAIRYSRLSAAAAKRGKSGTSGQAGIGMTLGIIGIIWACFFWVSALVILVLAGFIGGMQPRRP